MKANLFRLMLVLAIGAPMAACGDDPASGDDADAGDTFTGDTTPDAGETDTDTPDTDTPDTDETDTDSPDTDETDTDTPDVDDTDTPDTDEPDTDTPDADECVDDDAEDDDTTDTATLLENDATIADRVLGAGDVDVFATPLLLPGEAIAATVTFDGGTVTGRVIDLAGEEFATATSDTGTLELAYEPSGFAAGNYYFELSSDDCPTYAITASYTPDEVVECPADAAEDDDDLSDNAVELGEGVTITDRTANGGDIDYFVTPFLTPGSSVYAQITFEGEGSVTGSVLDTSLNVVGTATSDTGTLDLFDASGGFAGGNFLFAITADGCVDYSIEARYDQDPPFPEE